MMLGFVELKDGALISFRKDFQYGSLRMTSTLNLCTGASASKRGSGISNRRSSGSPGRRSRSRMRSIRSMRSYSSFCIWKRSTLICMARARSGTSL